MRVRLTLHRLHTLTPPTPAPPGSSRPATAHDHPHLVDWCHALAEELGEQVTVTTATWPATRFPEKRYTYWQTPDGTPVSMAGINPTIAGQARIDPVYTPARHRGHGYAAAVTAAVSRTARATDVVLFTNTANPTSNALYHRLGYRPIAHWSTYDFID